MADNIILNPGSGGATLSTDEVTRASIVQHVQYVKLMDGTDGSIGVIPGDASQGLDVDVTRLPADTAITGSLTAAGQSVELNVDRGETSVGIQLTGTWVATVVFEVTVDGTAWVSWPAYDGANTTASTTANGVFVIPAGPFDRVRVRASAFTSGIVNVALKGCRGATPVLLTGAIPTGTNVIGGTDVTDRTARKVGQVFLRNPGDTANLGDSANPVRVDPTGTTVQPVSGTVTADTELPAAAALADAAGNPTTPTVGAANLVFNGTSWDRVRGDITNGIDVDVTRVQGNVTVVQATAANLNATVTGTVTANQGGAWSVDTELPAAAALADAAANPTTPTVGAAALVFNGTTWDRVRGDTTNGVDVDVTRVQGNVTVVQATAANLNATVTGTVAATQSGAWSVDTELPAASALGDAMANPTTPTAGSATLLFNGTTWDRARGDTTNGLDVDVTRVQGTVSTNLAQIGGTAQSGANVVDTTNSALRVNVVAGGGSGGTSSNFGAAFPGTGTAAGYNDGTNMQGARVFDLDTGAGTQYVLGVNLRQAASGGSIEVGTAAAPLRVDPTGTTTQPVSGTVTADTELPAAAALADGAANPTTPTVGSATLLFNGTTWDRARGDTANGLDVDVTRVQGTVSTNLAQIGGTAQSGANVVDTTNSALRVNVVAGGGSGGTSSNFGAAFPGTGTAAGYSDGTNMQEARVFDLDTGAGTQYVLGVNLRQSASGGSIEVGTSSAPLRIDPTGTTTQPVSGTVTADTELPAAAALADGAANPTTPTAGSATLVFNGATWDRARGDTTNGLDVDVTRVQGNVTVVQSTAANLNATVTGTVTANQGGTWSVVDAGAAKTLKRAVVSLTATGTVISAVSGRRLKVYQYALQSRNDSMTVRFRDGSAGGNLGLEWSLNAREGVSSGPVNPPAFLFGTTAGNSLDAVLSGTGTVWIEVSYWDDDTS